MEEILNDELALEMFVVFCGTAVGATSARRGAYYAGRGNAFWKTLFDIGLTPRHFGPEEYKSAISLGIGFTDLAKTASGNDSILSQSHFGRDELRRKILEFQPRVVAFTSKRAASEFLKKPVQYGLLQERIGASLLFVLPSPSGAARRWWNVQVWYELARLIKDGAPNQALHRIAYLPQ